MEPNFKRRMEECEWAILVSRRTTGSPGVIGSGVTFVRFGSNMKPRYLGTSNHIVKVGIEAFSYGK